MIDMEGKIVQMGYIVDNLDTAVERWVRCFGIGPWFVVRNFSGLRPIYSGSECIARNDLAFAYSGGVQYELIMPLDTHPSVWNQTRSTGSASFHHFGVATKDVAGRSASLALEGFKTIFTDELPTGGQVVYMDPLGTMPGMIELLPLNAGFISMFDTIRNAAVDWDNRHPTRPLLF